MVKGIHSNVSFTVRISLLKYSLHILIIPCKSPVMDIDAQMSSKSLSTEHAHEYLYGSFIHIC